MRTERLVLRHWRHADRQPFARLNADARVMEFMPSVLSEEESDSLVERMEAHFQEHGFGLHAAELQSGRRFIGYIGLSVPTFQAALHSVCGDRVETVERALGPRACDGRCSRDCALRIRGIEAAELVSFTVPANRRSLGVMKKLGMTYDPKDDFDHPRLPVSHTLRRHVLYRLSHATWSLRAAS
jgi:RimJ/RimL family protein N-acetyltransferase